MRAVSRPTALLLTLVCVLAARPALAQMDLSGEWGQRTHEDAPERGGGPSVGEYQGLPINAANRMKADAWDASKWTVPEHQCEPHPMDYGPRGPGNLRMWPDVEWKSQEITAWHTILSWMLPERTIWMDGRPHPPAYARHTWQGFSTGKWEGDMLVVTTTHLKTAWVRRNGLARSDKAVVTEYFLRHDNNLTLVTIVDDPIYLTEPLLRTSNWILDPGYHNAPYPCDVRVEIPRPKGAIPFHLPGANTFLNEFATSFGLPIEATRGGAETMYPEYQDKLKAMPVPPKPAK